MDLSAEEAQTVRLNPGSPMMFTATWYTPAGGWGSGQMMRSGLKVSTRFLATDPKVVPMGSIVEITYEGGEKEYRIAADTGGAIHGRIVDMFVWSHKEAIQKGRQKITLRVLGSIDLKEMKRNGA